MADEPPETGDPRDGSAASGEEVPAGGSDPRPSRSARWQKVLGVIGVVVAVLVVVLLVTGDHGPGRHAPDDAHVEPIDGAPAVGVVGVDEVLHPDRRGSEGAPRGA